MELLPPPRNNTNNVDDVSQRKILRLREVLDSISAVCDLCGTASPESIPDVLGIGDAVGIDDSDVFSAFIYLGELGYGVDASRLSASASIIRDAVIWESTTNWPDGVPEDDMLVLERAFGRTRLPNSLSTDDSTYRERDRRHRRQILHSQVKELGKFCREMKGQLPAVEVPPVTNLIGWRAILDAVNMKHTDQRIVKRLNEETNGPIPQAIKGGQPIVDKAKLIEWWNHQSARQQAMANQRLGKQLSAESTHSFGKTGEVAPEIAGSVKNRRST
jgi:hypothetical protein